MNIKNFIISGLVGGIVNFLLRWLFYGFLVNNPYPATQDVGLVSIILGCFTLGFLFAYIFLKWGHISTLQTGFKAGIVLGVFFGLLSVFFQQSDLLSAEPAMMVWEMVISIVVISSTCGAIGYTLHLLRKK